ncbi:hypothetical protein BDZ45DRAFT_753949 [Acephala macrosclerotiorum]|nr:hypothetical protein BDZ45DRAFT_753949 [Acephala macrosclerotiorum]
MGNDIDPENVSPRTIERLLSCLRHNPVKLVFTASGGSISNMANRAAEETRNSIALSPPCGLVLSESTGCEPQNSSGTTSKGKLDVRRLVSSTAAYSAFLANDGSRHALQTSKIARLTIANFRQIISDQALDVTQKVAIALGSNTHTLNIASSWGLSG